MRFPLRLTAELSFRLAARAFPGNSSSSLIERFDPAEFGKAYLDASNPPIRNRSQINTALSQMLSSAPVVWVGGSEPLMHPTIARVTRELTAMDRHVFLQRDGALLRRRIHEFQPVSRLFIAVACNEVGNQRAAEAVRIARLSGFLTCAHTEISRDTDLLQIERLRDHLLTLGVECWFI